MRGIRLDDGDTVISMAILRHVEATPAERAAYLKQAAMLRRAQGEDIAEAEPAAEADADEEAAEGGRADAGALRRARRQASSSC